ncbi:hypothetical protein GTA08_BOTSDO13963 [Botryosphaeria dothidea]|uniref:Uncharacterized protein n=1 Tax=Botryosphaeria dothidea TaxID=55169 RepID=A0A8H4J4A2_9PEZI|nr:hypothetical protein GTA08_BOTSDO03401 [Botryosphaeria dothidea]KAF4310533.1 hypothetical protein GTA08_BOTSDO13963 [Botryosphaeria dothidea]
MHLLGNKLGLKAALLLLMAAKTATASPVPATHTATIIETVYMTIPESTPHAITSSFSVRHGPPRTAQLLNLPSPTMIIIDGLRRLGGNPIAPP